MPAPVSGAFGATIISPGTVATLDDELELTLELDELEELETELLDEDLLLEELDDDELDDEDEDEIDEDELPAGLKTITSNFASSVPSFVPESFI